jgi:NADH:ubiquinone oxidoreductase subunit C
VEREIKECRAAFHQLIYPVRTFAGVATAHHSLSLHHSSLSALAHAAEQAARTKLAAEKERADAQRKHTVLLQQSSDEIEKVRRHLRELEQSYQQLQQTSVVLEDSWRKARDETKRAERESEAMFAAVSEIREMANQAAVAMKMVREERNKWLNTVSTVSRASTFFSQCNVTHCLMFLYIIFVKESIGEWTSTDYLTLLTLLDMAQYHSSLIAKAVAPIALVEPACEDLLVTLCGSENEPMRFAQARLLRLSMQHIHTHKSVPSLIAARLNALFPDEAKIYSSEPSKPMVDWDIKDVTNYLSALQLENLASICDKERVCGCVLLSLQHDKDWDRIGFTAGDRVKVKEIFDRLRSTDAVVAV